MRGYRWSSAADKQCCLPLRRPRRARPSRRALCRERSSVSTPWSIRSLISEIIDSCQYVVSENPSCFLRFFEYGTVCRAFKRIEPLQRGFQLLGVSLGQGIRAGVVVDTVQEIGR